MALSQLTTGASAPRVQLASRCDGRHTEGLVRQFPLVSPLAIRMPRRHACLPRIHSALAAGFRSRPGVTGCQASGGARTKQVRHGVDAAAASFLLRHTWCRGVTTTILLATVLAQNLEQHVAFRVLFLLGLLHRRLEPEADDGVVVVLDTRVCRCSSCGSLRSLPSFLLG